MTEPTRVLLLKAGAELTSGDRDKEYGPPSVNLSKNAMLVQAYLRAKYDLDINITAEDVAWILVLTKIARTFQGNPKADTYIDAGTYAAIAGELAIQMRDVPE